VRSKLSLNLLSVCRWFQVLHMFSLWIVSNILILWELIENNSCALWAWTTFCLIENLPESMELSRLIFRIQISEHAALLLSEHEALLFNSFENWWTYPIDESTRYKRLSNGQFNLGKNDEIHRFSTRASYVTRYLFRYLPLSLHPAAIITITVVRDLVNFFISFSACIIFATFVLRTWYFNDMVMLNDAPTGM